MKITTAALALLLVVPTLTGCAEMVARMQEEHRNYLANRCGGYGIQRGDPGFAGCAMQVEQLDAANNQALLAASIQLLNNSGPSALPAGARRFPGPTMVTCTTMSYQTNCMVP